MENNAIQMIHLSEEMQIDDDPVCCCCKEKFMCGDFIFRDGDGTYCLDCFLDWVFDLADTSPAEIAKRLGFDVEVLKDTK